MDELENLGNELLSIANRIEDIRVELYRNEEYKNFFFLKKSFKKKMIGFSKFNPIYATWHTF